MRKILLILCLLMLSTSAWAVSPLGYTNLGVCPLGTITAANDTLYMRVNMTPFVAVGDPVILVSSITGKRHHAIIAAEAATYLVLAGAWTDSTDSAAKFMIPNKTLIWDAEGHVVFFSDATGDSYWFAEDGSTIMSIDQSAGSLSFVTAEYGELAFADSTKSIATTTQNQWVQVTNSPVGSTNSMTATVDSLTITTTGTFKMELYMSFTGDANDIFEAALKVNGVMVDDHKFSRKTANTDVGSATLGGLLELSAGDDVTIWVRNTDASPNAMVIVDMSFILNKIN